MLDVTPGSGYRLSTMGVEIMSELDLKQTLQTLTEFLRKQLESSGLEGFVVGLSGGIDSALSSSLAVNAVGKDRILGILMPFRTSSTESVSDARELAAHLGIKTREIDISPMVDAYFPEISENLLLRAGNKMARERMSILFDIAAETRSLVLGTGNRTEIALGYTTWYGDSACSINPLAELYKREVRKLSAMLDVPKSILTKAPSADLWTGQTDEGEIGVTYEEIDKLLKLIIDQGLTSRAVLLEKGFESADIERVVSLVNANSFKRKLPETASLDRPPIPYSVSLQE
ncbi:MAG: NAD+ synthase [bacterium]|nr:NAD+ synthase [bacterium]